MSISPHLRLEFVTPERAIVHDDVDEVELPGEDGYFGVLPGHAPLLASLRPGMLWYRTGAKKTFAFVGGGHVEVLPDRVAVLAEVAEHAEDIDEQRAEASKRRAEERLGHPTSDVDFESARADLLKALARLDVVRHIRRHS